LLQCTRCSWSVLSDLIVCPECLTIACVSCTLGTETVGKKSPKVRSIKGQKSSTPGVGASLETPAGCFACRRQVVFKSILNMSAAASRICEGYVATNGDLPIECVICGELCIRNRTCTTCAVLYCVRCLEQWEKQCSKTGSGELTCAHCRTVCSIDDFPQDRFIAKLAATWFQQQSQASKLKTRRKSSSRVHQNKFVYDVPVRGKRRKKRGPSWCLLAAGALAACLVGAFAIATFGTTQRSSPRPSVQAKPRGEAICAEEHVVSTERAKFELAMGISRPVAAKAGECSDDPETCMQCDG